MEVKINRGTIGRWSVFALVAFLAVALILPFVLPMIVGGIFGVILYPIHTRLRWRRVGPGASALVSTAFFTMLMFIPIAVVLFVAAQTGIEVLQRWGADVGQRGGGGANGAGDLWRGVGEWLRSQPVVDRLIDALPISSDEFLRMWRSVSLSVGGWLSEMLQSFMGGVPQALIWSIVMFVTIFFCFRDGPRAVDKIRRYSPFSAPATDVLIQGVGSSCRVVVLASVVSGIVQATIIGMGCVITQTPGVAVIAVLTFFSSFVPLIGTGPVTLGLVIYALASGGNTSAVILLAAGGLAGVSDNFVRPYVIQGGQSIHPLLAFVSVFGAIGVIGVSGILIGPIVVGVAMKMLPLMAEKEVRGKPLAPENEPDRRLAG